MRRTRARFILSIIFMLVLFTAGCDLTPGEIEFIRTQLAPLISPLADFSTPSPPPVEQGGAALCVPQDTVRLEGEVVDVIDGDTIDVLLEDGREARVRYIGIDTPERGDTFYSEASNVNEELVLGKRVTLVRDVSETDRYGRLLAYVFVDELFVNYEIVRRGYAAPATFPPDVACADTFAEAARLACEDGAGLCSIQ